MVILKITTVYSGEATYLGYKYDKNIIKNVKLRTPKTSIMIAQLMLPLGTNRQSISLLNYYTYKLSLIKLLLSFPS